MTIDNRTKYDIQFKYKGKVIYFGKEINANRIPLITYSKRWYKVKVEDKIVSIKVMIPKKILNLPERRNGEYYIVDENVARIVKRDDLITPSDYKKINDVLYCRSFKAFEEAKNE